MKKITDRPLIAIRPVVQPAGSRTSATSPRSRSPGTAAPRRRSCSRPSIRSAARALAALQARDREAIASHDDDWLDFAAFGRASCPNSHR